MDGRRKTGAALERGVAIALMAILCSLGASNAVRAASSSDWIRHKFVETRLIAATSGLSRAGKIWLGLHIKLAPGWHTYWRTPGDSGLPTRLDWAGSMNVKDTAVEWPLPQRLHSFDQDNFVYVSEVVIPIEVTSADPTRPVQIDLKVEYGVCREICVPMADRHRLSVSPVPGGPRETDFTPLIEQSLLQVPERGQTNELVIERVALVSHGDQTVLEIIAGAALPFESPDAFVEAPTPNRFGAPKVMLKPDGKQAVLHLPIFGARPGQLAGKAVRLTLFDGIGRAIERTVEIENDLAIPFSQSHK
ncbi:MAG: protein-disulfide reductase DsbD domain-containing protein [Sphingomonadales bacterium]